MAYGKKTAALGMGPKGHKAIIGTKLSTRRKGSPGLKLHSDMNVAHAHGHKQAPKAARKAV